MTASLFHYQMCGLTCASDIPIPGVAPLDAPVQTVDVRVRRAPVSSLDAPTWADDDAGWSLTAEAFVLTHPRLGRFAALAGQELRMDLLPDVTPAEAIPFLIGTTFAALLYQRCSLVLHGSAVRWRDKAYVFCGPTGRGKSTLAAALCEAGAELLSDDLCRIEPGTRPILYSDGRMPRLTPESIAHLGWETRRSDAVGLDDIKYHVPVPRSSAASLPVARIYTLAVGAPDADVALEPLPPAAACAAVYARIYRRRFALLLTGGSTVTQRIAMLARTPGVSRLVRPPTCDRLGDVVTCLTTHWNREQ